MYPFPLLNGIKLKDNQLTNANKHQWNVSTQVTFLKCLTKNFIRWDLRWHSFINIYFEKPYFLFGQFFKHFLCHPPRLKFSRPHPPPHTRIFVLSFSRKTAKSRQWFFSNTVCRWNYANSAMCNVILFIA